MSHPTRDGWIEIPTVFREIAHPWSHPTRDGWIEIVVILEVAVEVDVPSHTGWVD